MSGGAVTGEVLRRGLADEVRYSILPVAIWDGIRIFEGLDRDIALHLLEVRAYKSGAPPLSDAGSRRNFAPLTRARARVAEKLVRIERLGLR
jgi:hypothetical protein